MLGENGNNKERTLRDLTKQIWHPVRWEQTLHTLYTRPKESAHPQTFEVGPGHQLGVLLKNTNLAAYQSYKNIDV